MPRCVLEVENTTNGEFVRLTLWHEKIVLTYRLSKYIILFVIKKNTSSFLYYGTCLYSDVRYSAYFECHKNIINYVLQYQKNIIYNKNIYFIRRTYNIFLISNCLYNILET